MRPDESDTQTLLRFNMVGKAIPIQIPGLVAPSELLVTFPRTLSSFNNLLHPRSEERGLHLPLLNRRTTLPETVVDVYLANVAEDFKGYTFLRGVRWSVCRSRRGAD
jgi:hypothetical protein